MTSHAQMMHFRLVPICAIAMLSMAGRAFSQQSSGYHPLPVEGGARSAALGGVTAAEAFDPSSMYGNPAALLFIERRFLTVNHVQEVLDPSMSEGAAFAFPASREDMFGVGLMLTHTGNLNQSGGAALQFMQYGMDIAYARAVTPTLSLGGRVGASTAESGTGSTPGPQLTCARSTREVAYRWGCVSCRLALCRSEMSCSPRRSPWRHPRARCAVMMAPRSWRTIRFPRASTSGVRLDNVRSYSSEP